ncbi:MAG: LacI family DNA-binding transcriptional regulator [Rhodobacter sp.]|nr:LacI family DNA-binding transcriptional regulator [Rhodobacter sp.]
MTVTLKHVAERAGVSRSAVSRCFTEGASISAGTRAKVERAAAELGYCPNVLARSLTTRSTRLIGLVSNNFHNPVFLQIFDLFTRGLQDRGLRPLLVNLSEETDPARSVRMLRQYSVDGVIVASSTLPGGFARAFREAGMPVVHAFGRPAGRPDVHVVGIDNIACGRIAAATLIGRGYGRLGFLGGPEAASTTQDRMAGFLAEVSRHPGTGTVIRFAEAYSFDAGRAAMQAGLAEGCYAEAWFCGDDVLSLGAISALRDAGLSVPGDVGVIGLNDMDMAGWAGVALTTIHQPFAGIIAASIDLVTAMLDDPARAPVSRIFPCWVVERGTLRAPP